MTIDDIRTIAQFLAVLAAATAAGFAGWNARNARMAADANLLLTLLKDWRSEEFRVAIHRLKEFKRLSNHAEGFAVDCALRITNRNADADDLDGKRRVLAQFYNIVRVLAERGMLDRELLLRSFGVDAFQFFLDVVEPIDREYASRVFERIAVDNRPFFQALVAGS